MIGVFAYVPRRINLELQAEVMVNEYRVCILCGYSLRDLPDVYRCPECGVKYTISDLEIAWKEWYGE